MPYGLNQPFNLWHVTYDLCKPFVAIRFSDTLHHSGYGLRELFAAGRFSQIVHNAVYGFQELYIYRTVCQEPCVTVQLSETLHQPVHGFRELYVYCKVWENRLISEMWFLWTFRHLTVVRHYTSVNIWFLWTFCRRTVVKNYTKDCKQFPGTLRLPYGLKQPFNRWDMVFVNLS